MHPLLALLATRPQLLVDHALAYAALLGEEFELASDEWLRRALLQVAALCFLCVTVALTGVALMLWMTLGIPANSSWALVVIPLFPLLISVVCLLLARQPQRREPFANLSRQVNADMALLRAVGKP
ncbi:hypothetical protein [Rhodoferax sp.]|uniref:hypothetical protein n=1 Tax=Rhodoferax sp. TaxID=50421 RepID=UPI002850D3D6|nr:hypothetical protein [Rhodoferax sp.]MDR3368989.1 hypothetical protein [Rhodoferax sp.]